MNLQKKNAFTLTEIMVVLVIIAIIAGLAVPGYFRTVEQSRSNEALSNLNIIHMGEKIYRLNSSPQTFWGPGTDVATINAALNTDMQANYYTTVSVTATPTTYTAKFTRNATSGGAGTKWFQYSFTDGDAKPTPTEGGAY